MRDAIGPIAVMWFVASVLVAEYALRRGRRRVIWFAASMLLSPVFTLLALILVAGGSEAGRLCEYCGGLVSRDCKTCVHCNADIAESAGTPSRV